jgi:transposase-like protein
MTSASRIKTRGPLANDEAAPKLVYLAIKNVNKTGAGATAIG